MNIVLGNGELTGTNEPEHICDRVRIILEERNQVYAGVFFFRWPNWRGDAIGNKLLSPEGSILLQDNDLRTSGVVMYKIFVRIQQLSGVRVLFFLGTSTACVYWNGWTSFSCSISPFTFGWVCLHPATLSGWIHAVHQIHAARTEGGSWWVWASHSWFKSISSQTVTSCNYDNSAQTYKRRKHNK